MIPYRLPPAPAGYKPTYIDLDGDGDPDILRTVTANGIPVQWIDDDDDMQYGDEEAIEDGVEFEESVKSGRMNDRPFKPAFTIASKFCLVPDAYSTRPLAQ